MEETIHFSRRSWRKKFRDAFRGVKRGVRGHGSFFVHFFVAVVVGLAAWTLRVGVVEWCLLLACVTAVLAAEMFNSALEELARAIDKNPNPHLRDALDISSAAVLLASIGAAIIGSVVFVNRLGLNLMWW